MNKFWFNWLRAVCIYYIVFGILMALAIMPPFDRLLILVSDLAFWPIDGKPDSLTRENTFLLGVAGAIFAGWGYSLYLLITHGFPTSRAWVWNAVAVPLTFWFIIDNIVSYSNGAYGNFGVNIFFYGLLMVPLLVVRPHFSAKKQPPFL